MNKSDFRRELEILINRNSLENVSGTPDFILAEYLIASVAVFDRLINKREKWYGRGKRKLLKTN